MLVMVERLPAGWLDNAVFFLRLRGVWPFDIVGSFMRRTGERLVEAWVGCVWLTEGGISDAVVDSSRIVGGMHLRARNTRPIAGETILLYLVPTILELCWMY